MARRTFKHETATGEIDTRTSATKNYTHVVVGDGYSDEFTKDGTAVVLRWSESAEAAQKAVGSRDLGGAKRRMWVEAINGGER